jgi:ankyrin repeat protein
MPMNWSTGGYGDEVTRIAPRSPAKGSARESLALNLLASPQSVIDLSDEPQPLLGKNFNKDDIAGPPIRFAGKTTEDWSLTNLHPLLMRSEWKDLLECVATLSQLKRPNMIHEALSKRDDREATALHTAAWKAPPKLARLIIDLIPHEERKQYLLSVDGDGNTPLHLACANLDELADFMIIKHVLVMAPEALEMGNDSGDSPLHLLVCSPGFCRGADCAVENAAEEAITSLLKIVGNVANIRNASGATILHVAIAHGAHERVLFKLINMRPEAAFIPDKRGMLPIHYVAAFGGTPFTFVEQLICAFPEGITAQTENGDTPLHLLISNAHKYIKEDQFLDRNTTKLAELLVGSDIEENCPLFVRNNEHLSPLHGCSIFNSPPQLTKILMDSPLAGRASCVTNRFNATALHLVCVNSNVSDSLANLEALATTHACAIFDIKDRTPLMVAVQNSKASSKVTKALIKACPEAAKQANEKGQLPLHLAVHSKKAKESVVKALLIAYPEGAHDVTHGGNTPLHEACKHGASIEVIERLIAQCPDALKHKNDKGKLPIDRALSGKASDKVIAVLKGESFVPKQLQHTVSEFTVDFSLPDFDNSRLEI